MVMNQLADCLSSVFQRILVLFLTQDGPVCRTAAFKMQLLISDTKQLVGDQQSKPCRRRTVPSALVHLIIKAAGWNSQGPVSFPAPNEEQGKPSSSAMAMNCRVSAPTVLSWSPQCPACASAREEAGRKPCSCCAGSSWRERCQCRQSAREQYLCRDQLPSLDKEWQWSLSDLREHSRKKCLSSAENCSHRC